MHEMVQTIRAIARDQAAQAPASALGLVTSLHADPEYACTVALRESGVVLPRVPIATGLLGVAALPREGDLVLVVFVAGDLHAPYVVGRLYSDATAPPSTNAGELTAWLPGSESDETKSIRLAVSTPDDGTRAIEVVLGGDVEVAVHVKDGEVSVSAGAASLKLTAPDSSSAKAELAVNGSSVVIEQGGDVTITASGKLALKANQVEISGDASVKLAGQTIDLN
jgi:uncharacterized protein involved in type VI secretion and phage assembly